MSTQAHATKETLTSSRSLSEMPALNSKLTVHDKGKKKHEVTLRLQHESEQQSLAARRYILQDGIT